MGGKINVYNFGALEIVLKCETGAKMQCFEIEGLSKDKSLK
jgi:hypothetical protein